MIVTSYTRLVVDSHRADCASLVGGLSRRIGRRSIEPALPQAYSERDGVMVRLGQTGPIAADVAELAHVTSGQIRGAA
jgi:hypothetical protein